MAAEQPKRLRCAVRAADDPPLSPKTQHATVKAYGRALGQGLGPGLTGVKGSGEETDIEEALVQTGYGLFSVALLLTGVLSALSHQGNTAMLSYLLPSAECDLGLTPVKKGVLAATPYAGMLCSGLTWGFLSDTVGRRRLLIIAYLLDGVSNLLSSLTQAFWFLLMMRFFGGFIISGPMAIQKTFLSEYHSAAQRPRIMMWTGVFVAVANVFFPAAAWGVLPLPFEWRPLPGFVFNSWRLFVAVSALPGLGAALAIWFFSESPKYLLASGRGDEALRVLRNMYRWNKGADPSTFPVRRLRAEAGSPVLTSGATMKSSPLQALRLGWRQVRPLFLHPHRSRAILVFAIQFCTLLGMNTLRLWVPQLFSSIEEYHLEHTSPEEQNVPLCQMLAAAKHPDVRAAATAHEDAPCTVALLENTVYIRAGIVGAASAAAFLTACFTINLTGKRAMMVGSFVVGGAAGIAMYWSRSDTATLAMSSTYVALVGVAHTVAIAIAVDLFPTTLRNMAVSLTLMAGQLGTVLGNVSFPLLMELDCELVFFLLGGVALACAGLCLLLPPMEKGDSS